MNEEKEPSFNPEPVSSNNCETLRQFDLLPEKALLRMKHIIGDSKTDPPIPPLIPISRSAWLDGIKQGHYPKSVKLPGCPLSFWRVSTIRELLESLEKLK